MGVDMSGIDIIVPDQDNAGLSYHETCSDYVIRDVPKMRLATLSNSANLPG